MICAKCGRHRAHRSHRSGLKDWVQGLFQYTPYRCRDCGTRFYAWRDGEKSDKLRTREEQKVIQLRRKLKWKRSKRSLYAYGAGALVLAAALYEIIQQRLPPSVTP
jgi:DNA-directed RNA polymerase subunit RPC12/RpoP